MFFSEQRETLRANRTFVLDVNSFVDCFNVFNFLFIF